ncbi:MAG TPA: LUD domain-containing protein [Terriglobales bacterium]|nr:LUD domain-containing protein [Terriglobales bacterium]
MSAPASNAQGAASESPRKFADKSAKGRLLAAIRMALRDESEAVHHNVQHHNAARYRAISLLPDYQQLKDRTRAIKEDAIERLPELIATVEAAVKRNGGHFHLARDAEDAARYTTEVCRRRGAKLAVKAKSMTTEEIGLNRALEAAGVEVVETDLGEFIIQIADEQPSHIVGPALHYSPERIRALFQRVFKTTEQLESGEELTRFARERLREKFLAAGAGISGANFVCADSGTIALVENEANIRASCILPPLHIAIAGVEKVIPSRKELAPFVELLAASGTGQPLSVYTSIFSPPLKAPLLDAPNASREFHLVLIDNGRLRMREDPQLREALYCIRCSACLNSCANFQSVGGHAFGGATYSGGIGGPWEAGTRTLEHGRFSELCTGCSRCLPNCPVRIDIPWLNIVLRQRLNQKDASAGAKMLEAVMPGLPREDGAAPLSKIFFGHYDLFGRWGSRMAGLANRMGKLGASRALMEKVVGLDRRRALPPFAARTMAELCRAERPAPIEPARARVVLFADVFTNYGSPCRGLATLRVLRSLGVDVVVSDSLPDGRAALSQGLIATATQQARRAAELLRDYVANDRDVVIVEPSVLATFRLDLGRLFPDDAGRKLFEQLRTCCFDSAEYVWRLAQRERLDAARQFPAHRLQLGTRLFYHSHCQQKTVGAATATEELLRACGFDVVTSQVECCGMAGSFGYKKDFYDLSMNVGSYLFKQVEEAERDGKRVLVATGTSCQEQLHQGLSRTVYHPMDLLAEIAQPLMLSS